MTALNSSLSTNDCGSGSTLLMNVCVSCGQPTLSHGGGGGVTGLGGGMGGGFGGGNRPLS